MDINVSVSFTVDVNASAYRIAAELAKEPAARLGRTPDGYHVIDFEESDPNQPGVGRGHIVITPKGSGAEVRVSGTFVAPLSATPPVAAIPLIEKTISRALTLALMQWIKQAEAAARVVDKGLDAA